VYAATNEGHEVFDGSLSIFMDEYSANYFVRSISSDIASPSIIVSLLEPCNGEALIIDDRRYPPPRMESTPTPIGGIK
jgi:hypothetical protein